MLKEVHSRIDYWKSVNRIGPDIPFTHWRLYFKSTMRVLCLKHFSYFGTDAEFRPGAYAECCKNISIGNRVVIRPGSFIYADQTPEGTITIEDDVMMGSGVHIYVNNHRYDSTPGPISSKGYFVSQPVHLKSGSWIGANSIILPGVIIGRNAVVGAGSIVTKSVPDLHLVAGNPAQILKIIQ